MSNKSIDEMIEVMQAFKAGRKIQTRITSNDGWVDVVSPSWMWAGSDYRVKPEPRVFSFYFNEQSGGIVSVGEYTNSQAYYSKLGYKLVIATENING